MMFDKLFNKIAKSNKYPLLIKAPILLASSWLFQGILYMDRTERRFKILLDVLFFIPIFFILNSFLNFYQSFIFSFIISHSINWIFNGQIFVVFKNLNLIYIDSNRFFQYLDEIKLRVEKQDFILVVAAFGSFARKELRLNSDLDIRIIRKRGIIYGLKGCIFLMKERSWAFFNFFPLDIYLLDDVTKLNVHIDNEDSVILFDSANIIGRVYHD